MAVEKIHNRQLILMLFLIRSVIAIAFLPVLTTGTAGRDVWASSIVMYLGTVLMTLLIVGLGVKFKDKSVIQYSQDLLGNVLGRVVGLVILWMFLHMAATEVRIYGELINIVFLTRTPLVFIIAGITFLSAITVYLGIEVIGRMADFIIPWYIILLGFGLILPLPEVMAENYEPIFAGGITPVLSSSLTSTAIGTQVLTVAIILPHVNEPEKGLKASIVSMAMAAFVVLAVSLVVVGVVGAELGSSVYFPFLFAIRNTNTAEILERIEIVVVLAWGMGIYLALCVYLYCGAKGVSQFFNVESYRPLVFPMAIIWVALSIHSYDSIFQLQSFFAPEIFLPYAMVAVIIPYGLLWGSYLIRYKIMKIKGDKQ